jgi:adenylate kinase
VLLVKVRDEFLVERLTARWTCPTCGSVYNRLSSPPKVEGKCDKDGNALTQRDDDKPATVKNRLNVYYTQTAPLIDFYRAAGVLREANGEQEIARVQAEIIKIVESL